MARRGEISYFLKINDDVEFETLIDEKEKSLIILDAYQEIFGPCTSMHSTLEQIKRSQDDVDAMHLAMCNADSITKLKRFRGKCQPTFIFCYSRKVVDIIYGVDIPLITKTIQKHLASDKPCNDGDISNGLCFDFDEPLPFEQVELRRVEMEKAEKVRIEKETAEAEKIAELNMMLELMAINSPCMGVTIFMPHVAKEARKTYLTAKSLALSPKAEKIIQITADVMKNLNDKFENSIDENILNYIYDKDLFAVLWDNTYPQKEIADVLKEFIERVSEPQPVKEEENAEEGTHISGALEPSILEPLIIISTADDIKSDDNDKIKDENENKVGGIDSKEMLSEPSLKASNSQLNGSEELISDENRNVDENKLIIPPVWTPENKDGNAAFMCIFFRNQFETFLPPLVEPEPPHLCMILPASERHRALEVSESFPGDLRAFGFFEGENFEDFSLVCKTVEMYEKLPTKSGNEKIILKVARKTSKLLLSLMPLYPVHVSLNVKEGEEECSIIFNDNFYATKEENDDEDEDEKDEDNNTIENENISANELEIMPNDENVIAQ